MYAQVSKYMTRALALAFVVLVPVALVAQSSPKSNAGDSPSKWDIFAGYSYLAPKGTVNTPWYGGVVLPVQYRSITRGGIVSVARYFNKYVGVEGVGDVHYQNESTLPSNDFSGGMGGLILRLPTSDITAFAHGLVGFERIGGPHWQSDKWGVGFTAGGGVDYATEIKYFSKRDDYTQAGLVGISRKVQLGEPDLDMASNAHVERTNLSVRTFTRRFTRCTLGYSKKLENHKHAVALFIWHFNYCRKHSAHKQTPAMAAGLTDRVWTIAELLQGE